MQRLEVIYLGNIVTGYPPPLTDEAHYWEFYVKSCDDVRYLEAVGYGEDGEASGEHVVPFNLVRSVSARPVPEQQVMGEAP